MRLQSLLLVCVIWSASPCNAQNGAPANQLSHDQVIARISGLMYVHGMAQKCPFPKDVSDTLEILAMVAAAGIPKISPEETADVARRTDARVAKDIAESKAESCQKTQQAVEAMAAVLAKKSPTKAP